MTVAVRRDLVALRDDRAHEARKALGHPAEHEEGRANSRVAEDLEQTLRVAADTALHPVPAVARDDAVEHAHMEVVLDVHGHRVHDERRRGRCPHAIGPGAAARS